MTTTAPRWPSLSLDLTGPRHPERCQNCSVGHPLEVWREHDDSDAPTTTMVVLCPACANRLVEPHERLYSRLDRYAPFPGVLPICVDCVHRDGVSCRSPKAKLNGGDGIHPVFPKPMGVHLCRRGKGQRSGWIRHYTGPVKDCSGREVAS